MDIYIGNCDGIQNSITLKNTVLEIFHFRISKVMNINFIRIDCTLRFHVTELTKWHIATSAREKLNIPSSAI